MEFWDTEAGPFEPYMLVHRSVFAREATRLRALLEERAELVRKLKENRQERQGKVGEMHRLVDVKRGAARPFPGEALVGDDPLTEGEAEARFQRLDGEVDALAEAIKSARDRLDEIAATLRSGWVAVPLARLPSLDPPVEQE